MKRGVRQKEGEDFSPIKIEEIINLLESDTPITKKVACAKLGMVYNVARLGKLIEKHKEDKAYNEKRRKELRNKPLTKEDYSYIVSSYLEEANLSLIADVTHRSPAVIKRVLEKYNIPLRSSKTTYFNPIYLNDDAISMEYTNGDLVYSARYDEPAYISKLIKDGVYRIWLVKTQQYSSQPYWELGDLRKLQKEFSITLECGKYWGGGELQQAIAEARKNAKKGKKE